MTSELVSSCPASIWVVLDGGGLGSFRVVVLWLDMNEPGEFLRMEAGFGCLSRGGFPLVLMVGCVIDLVVGLLIGWLGGF